MAQWVSANLSNLLPGEVDTIFSAIDALTSIVSTPLEAVSSILDTASSLLVSLDPFDYLSTVRGLIEDFKNDILGTGFYVLDMWDYPAKQLEQTSVSFNSTYGNPRVSGDTFEYSFQQVLLDSFDDDLDTNRPQFTGTVSLMLIVVGRGTIDDLNVIPEEDHIGYAWKGLDSSVRDAGQRIKEIRLRAMMATLRQVAEVQPSDKVAVRVERVQRAFRLMSYMSRDDMDLIPVPMNPETGDSFFENTLPGLIDWEEDVAPVLESIEDFYESKEYPDWGNATLKDIYPDLAVILDTIFDPILELFASGGTILQAVKDLVAAIKAKLAELDRLIDLIDEIEQELEDFLNTTGMHVLFVETSNGIEDIKVQIQNATNLPFHGNGYYAGMAVLVGGPNAAVFNTLFRSIADTTEGTADP